MEWIEKYDLFLFDFDGLLVNTEYQHYRAYQQMCLGRGFELPWSFPRYCLAAHFNATGLRDQVYAEFPALYEIEPNWDILYQEKKKAYAQLIESGEVGLMPGVEELLIALEKKNIKRSVVTHSPLEHIEKIRQQNPLLETIPYWFTREHYQKPKPDPECYLLAIEKLATENDRIVGFEDTPRGLKALMETKADAFFITEISYDNMDDILKGRARHYPTLEAIESGIINT